MTHDPLCPWHKFTQEEVSCRDSETLITFCEVIAKVREDMLAQCIAAVEATWHAVCDRKEYPQCDYCYIVIDVLETLRDLREKPTPPPLPPSVGVPEKRWFR